jgi:hypothetical protein
MTSGYSGTPLHKKLGFQDGMTVLQVAMPREVRALIDAEVRGIDWTGRPKQIGAAHLFVTECTELKKQLVAIRKRLLPTGFIWVSWPKKSSGMASDVTENRIRDIALPLKLVDIKVCAVTEIWSGLKFVVPVKDRG